MYEKVIDIVQQKIRPYILRHGGDIVVLDICDNILKVRLYGQCSGCPSAKYSTRQMILEIVSDEIPSIKQVEIEEYTSPELLDMARFILNHEGFSET